MRLVLTALLAALPGWLVLLLVVASGPRGWVPMAFLISGLLVLARHAPAGRRAASAVGLAFPLALLFPAGAAAVLCTVFVGVEFAHLGIKVMPSRSALGRTFSGTLLALPLLFAALYLGGFSSHTLAGGKVVAAMLGALLAGVGAALSEWWVLRSPALRHALERG